jgi:lysozyme
MNKVRYGVAIIAVTIVLLSSLFVPLAQEQSYTVQFGDTLQAIADQFGVDVDALLQYNGLFDTSQIFVGQILRIPDFDVAPLTHLVQPGEILMTIAERYGVKEADIIILNNLVNPDRLTIGQMLMIPPTTTATPIPSVVPMAIPVEPTVREHVVQYGETLRQIGALYGVDFQSIATFNSIINPNIILLGQTLRIPDVTPTPSVIVATSTPVPAVAPVQTYVVEAGDNPALIAERYGVSLQSLIDFNDLRGRLPIYVGDVLMIPPVSGAGGGIITATAMPASQMTGFVAPGTYIVQPNESLSDIARRYNRNIYDIAEDNGLMNLNELYVGQALIIR